MKMRFRKFLTIAGSGIYVLAALGMTTGDGLSQGFPMMSPGWPGMTPSVPGIGSSIPGFNRGFPNSGMNGPGFNRNFPDITMNLPDFGQKFPDLNMKIPGFNQPNQIPGGFPGQQFPNPFNSFPNGYMNSGTALYDIGFYRHNTGEYARIIMQAHRIGQNFFVLQCTQRMQQISMECRTYVNGRIIRVNYVKAPIRQARFARPRLGEGFSMQGSGRWRDMEVTGTFQYRFNRPY